MDKYLNKLCCILFSFIIAITIAEQEAQSASPGPSIARPDWSWILNSNVGGRIIFDMARLKSDLLYDFETIKAHPELADKNKAIKKVITSESKAIDYLINHNGVISISEVYPDMTNPYEMPHFFIKSDKDEFIRFESPDLIKKMWGVDDEFLNQLLQKGLMKNNCIIDNIQFYPVEFEKDSSDPHVFIITGWSTDFLLKESISAKKRKKK